MDDIANEPLSVTTNCIIDKGLLCHQLDRTKEGSQCQSRDPRWKTSEQLEVEKYCTFTPRLKTHKSAWANRSRESYPVAPLYPEQDQFGNLLTRTATTMSSPSMRKGTKQDEFMSDPDSQSPSPRKYLRSKEKRSYSQLHEQRINAKTAYKFHSSPPSTKSHKHDVTSNGSSRLSSYPNSPQTQAKLKQFAANFSEAMNRKPNTPPKGECQTMEPDLFLTVNVNDYAVEQIAVNSDNVDVKQFVRSLALKYQLSPHKATKIEETLTNVVKEAQQMDTMSVFSLHTNTGQILEHNQSTTPTKDREEEQEQIFINLLSP